METFKTIFSVFSKESPIKIALSGVVSGIIYLFTPKTFIMLEKFGRFWYIVFWAAIVFLVVSLIVYFKNKFNENRNYKFVKKLNDNDKNLEIKNVLSKFKELANDMSPDDRELIRNFVKTNNEPLKRESNIHYHSKSLLGSNLIVSTTTRMGEIREVEINREKSQGIPLPVYTEIPGEKHYKLKEEVFEAYKYLYETTGKISDFD